ncbi:Hypothetical predicted protein [Octopus vulgaris]|uniref:Uncharacterized protein n=1 Tax=Octopus vulgaris TaxID=6645 RepID=A0AA36FBM9_OCTVU|nr:Hypothetical predicted protein [Octopus vulgaris]
MKSLGTDPEDIETLASDRAGWRTKVWNGMKAFEEARITHFCGELLNSDTLLGTQEHLSVTFSTSGAQKYFLVTPTTRSTQEPSSVTPTISGIQEHLSVTPRTDFIVKTDVGLWTTLSNEEIPYRIEKGLLECQHWGGPFTKANLQKPNSFMLKKFILLH